MTRIGAIGAIGLLGCVLAAPLQARAEPTASTATTAAGVALPLRPPPPEDTNAFLAALRPDRDVVLFPAEKRPGAMPTIIGATLAPGLSPTELGAVLLDPDAMRAALPSLIRAEVVATRAPSVRATATPDRLLAWEIEIPFFNLTGKAWLVHRGDSIDLELVEGAFAPGRVRFRPRWDRNRSGVALTCESRIDFRASSWIIRRLARHDPWAETAMAAAANWVLLRAVALRAANRTGMPAPRPTAPIVPPTLNDLQGAELAGETLATLRRRGRVALVHRSASGRLAFVSVAAPLDNVPPPVAKARLSVPERWLAFPGWKSVARHLPDADLFDVRDDIALVDLDATWRLHPGPSAQAVAGSISGAVLRWDFAAVPESPAGALAILSMYPRIDAAGFIERKMVAAEPLLEHAFALATVYADVAAIVDAFIP